MIDVRNFDELGTFSNDWLNAHYHFSFAGYHDPRRMGLGPLRVWNDDTIQAQTGFDPHPHRDMEIITYVRKGAISHKDSIGNEGRTEAGDVQVMHAGTGIVHAEMNLEDQETTLFQIWIMPDAAGHEPGWEARQFPKDPVSGVLPALVSGRDTHPDAMRIYQDAAVHGGRIDTNAFVTHSLDVGRAAYMVVSEGAVEVNGTFVDTRGGAVITDEHTLTINALEPSEVVLVDVPLN
jgi:redox-sensitive bicupin YhaK (pirin superfamily)